MTPSERHLLKAAAWHKGILRWKLKPHQLPIYDAVWNAIDEKPSLKYVVNCARRFGKTFTLFTIGVEYCLRHRNSQVRFAAPVAKEMRSIIRAMSKIIFADCPPNLKPKFNGQDNYYIFPNGSELHIASVNNQRADDLRGNASNLNIVDEAGMMDDLQYLIDSVLLPQTLTTGGKTIIASTPSVTPAHPYFDIYRECLIEGNVSEFTIYDNTSITPDKLAQYIKESGGENSSTWKREYLVQFVTDQDLAVTPEWQQHTRTHIDKDEYYQYYHKYVAMDTGVVDFTAVLYAYYDFQNGKLIVEDEDTVNGPTMTTEILSNVIKDKEKALWQDGKVYRRIADNNNLQIIQDLSISYQLSFGATNKESLTAMVNKVRIWISQDRIQVNDNCKKLLACLKFATWNPRKLQSSNPVHEMTRAKELGHFDHLAALIYLVRNIDEHTNPIPATHNTQMMTHFIDPSIMVNANRNAKVLQKAIFGK